MAIVFGFFLDDLDLVDLNIFTLGFMGFFLTLGFLSLASKTRQYLDAPDFARFYSEEALALDPETIKNNVIADMKKSYERNMNNHCKKAKWYDRALITLIISLGIMFLGIIKLKLS